MNFEVEFSFIGMPEDTDKKLQTSSAIDEGELQQSKSTNKIEWFHKNLHLRWESQSLDLAPIIAKSENNGSTRKAIRNI